ncbi:MAG TPA: tetratricopeptide repeat protein [Methylocella sp.]|nr:tetratricopeptide repeat protein [Methylocella sp.]
MGQQAGRTQAGASIHQAIRFLQAGETGKAAVCLSALDVSRETSRARCNLAGLILLAAGQIQLALEWFERALAFAPHDPETLLNRGVALQELLRPDEALAAYEEAMRAGCQKPALYYNHGNLLRSAGRHWDSLASYDLALRLDPSYLEALCAAGIVLGELKQYEEALERLDKAIAIEPRCAAALIHRGNLLQECERHEEALAPYSEALDLAPEPERAAEILNNRGSAYLALGRLPEAHADLAEALRLAPSLPQAWSNQGNLFLKLQQPGEALSAFEKALCLRPCYLEALCGRAVALKHLGRFSESLKAFDGALACDPSSPHARNNKAALLLLLGEFTQGLELYESRWIFAGTPKDALKLPADEWNGEPLEGKKIIVFDEQGNGDAIQFSRYLILLVRKGANVTFFCRRSLHRLFRTLGANIRLTVETGPGEHFDYQIALSSLPRAFKTRLETIPVLSPYLHAEPPLARQWAERIGPQGFKTGICWRGNLNPKADPSRSIPLSCFERLAGLEGVRLISLQKRDGSKDYETLPGLTSPGEDFDSGEDSFIHAAAVMQNLDLIVSCDTSIAHLAGALGKPVFVLLKQVPDWRWLLGREDSPWYPTMRLFRQRALGDWDEVMERVRKAILALCHG